MLKLLEWALENVGRYDIRAKDGKNLIEELNQFVESSASFDIESNEASLKGYIQMTKKYTSLLEENMKLDWNVKLGKEEEPTEVINHQGNWIFCLASPLKEEKKKYDCEGEGCDKSYNNAKYYQGHLKKEHGIIKKIEPPRVTCRMKHSRPTPPIAFDQIGSHLSRAHGLTKENCGANPEDVFRGYLSTDGGDDYQPKWLPVGAPDPQPPSGADQVLDNREEADQVLDNREEADQVLDNEEEAGQAIDVGDEAGQVLDVGDEADQVLDVVDEADKDLDARKELPQSVPFDEEEAAKDLDKLDDTASKTREKVVIVTGNNVLKEIREPAEKLEPEPSKILEPEPSKNEDKKKSDAAPVVSFSYEVFDLFCQDYDEPKSGTEESVNPEEIVLTEDSDIEDGDSSDFTKKRLANKENRYNKRSQMDKNVNEEPHNDQENSAFIEDFKNFLIKRSSTSKEELSTISKAEGHLFTYHDCLLKDLVKNHPGFKLRNLVSFLGPDLVELKNPIHGWLDSNSGRYGNENPSRMREQLKSFAFIREYLLVKLGQTDFEATLEGWMRKDQIKSNLQQLEKEIKDSKVWAKLKTLIDQNKQKVHNAKLLVNPSQNSNEIVSVPVYLSSKEFHTREENMMKLWTRFESGEEIIKKDFNDLANFVRHLLRKFYTKY